MAKKTAKKTINAPPCDGCGETAPKKVKQCPRCGASKCSHCDMGDDVECPNCLPDPVLDEPDED